MENKKLKNGVRIRRDGKGTEFGKMHRECLPGQLPLFDIDMIKYTTNGQKHTEIREDSTYMEYKCPPFGTLTFTALFDLKQTGSESLKEGLLVERRKAVWAMFMLATRVQARCFIVECDNKKQPFTFHEILGEGKYVTRGILEYTSEDRDQKVTEFWQRLHLL